MTKPDQDQEKKAVALKYDGFAAPKVTATGSGELAEEIMRLALEHEVPLFENPHLVELLTSLELGDEIPELLYECIAQIIAFAYRIQGKYPPGWEQRRPEDDGNQPYIDAPP